MKSKTKSEIARAAGISPEVLRRWMMEHRNVISAMGVRPTRRLLPPKVVRYICSELGIEDEDFNTYLLARFPKASRRHPERCPNDVLTMCIRRRLSEHTAKI